MKSTGCLLLGLFFCLRSFADGGVSVDFSATPTKVRTMTGFLAGFKPGKTPIGPIRDLGPALWKGSLEKLGTIPSSVGARFEISLAAAWGFPWKSRSPLCNPNLEVPAKPRGDKNPEVPESAWVAPYEAFARWEACLDLVLKKVSELKGQGLTDYDFDIWNEPNGGSDFAWIRRNTGMTSVEGHVAHGGYWIVRETDARGKNLLISDSSVEGSPDPNCRLDRTSSDSICNLARLFAHTHRYLTTKLGNGFRLGGPSANAKASQTYLFRFLGYLRKLDPAVRVGYVSWHEFRPSWNGEKGKPITDLGNYIAEVRRDIQRDYRDIVGEPAEIHINEYMNPVDAFRPASLVKYLEQLELGKPDFAAHTGWPDPQDEHTTVDNGTVDGMLSPGDFQMRSPWWVYRAYRDTLASRIPCSVTRDPYLTCFAEYDKARASARILVGYGVFDVENVRDSVEVDLNFSNLGSLANAPLTVHIIKNQSTALPEISQSLALAAGTRVPSKLTISLKPHEAAIVVLGEQPEYLGRYVRAEVEYVPKRNPGDPANQNRIEMILNDEVHTLGNQGASGDSPATTVDVRAARAECNVIRLRNFSNGQLTRDTARGPAEMKYFRLKKNGNTLDVVYNDNRDTADFSDATSYRDVHFRLTFPFSHFTVQQSGLPCQ